MDNLYLFIFLALLAEIIGTVSGFGSSLLFVPIASYFFDFHSVLGITALFHLSSNISKIYLFKRGIDWKLVLKIGIPAIVFVSFGAYLSKYLTTNYLEIGLAIFLIAVSLLFLIVQNIQLKPNLFNALAGGSISGFVAGLVGTGGAVRGITLAAFSLEKNTFIATSALIDFFIDASRSVVYFNNGYMHKHDLFLVPILLVVSIVGTLAGKKILNYVSEQNFKKIVLYTVLIVGISTLLKVIA
ncbi:MAG: sulfite exporter TauE/SafE family protein [Bacteroidota bacterium]